MRTSWYLIISALIFLRIRILYFYFKQILADLVDSKLVQTYTKEDDTNDKPILYELSNDGKNSLNLTIDVLPGLVKLKIDTILKNEVRNLINEDSIITEYIPENEHSYTVKCKIVENNKTIFEVRTFAGSNENAKIIADFYEITTKQTKKAIKGMKIYNDLLVAPSKLKRKIIYALLRISGNYKEMHGLIVNYEENPKCIESTKKLNELYHIGKERALQLLTENNTNNDLYHYTFSGKEESSFVLPTS